MSRKAAELKAALFAVKELNRKSTLPEPPANDWVTIAVPPAVLEVRVTVIIALMLLMAEAIKREPHPIPLIAAATGDVEEVRV